MRCQTRFFLLIFLSAATAAADDVKLTLERIAPGATTVSFGLPLPPGRAVDPAAVFLTAGKTRLGARVEPLLFDYDAQGTRQNVRSLLIQLPPTVAVNGKLEVVVHLAGGAPQRRTARVAYSAVSLESPEQVRTTHRTIKKQNGGAVLVEDPVVMRTLFVGREPRVQVRYPEGWLAHSRILGGQWTEKEAARPSLAGLDFFSKALRGFTSSALYEEGYALDPTKDSVPDPKENYEGWLYDRCATLLIAYAHAGDTRFLRAGFRACSYYASQIRSDGIFAGKPDPDPKYSHLRGLYAYYALTGDESALTAAGNNAEMWLSDRHFAEPYREGHLRGFRRLWTERLLGTSLEAMLYGSRITGEKKYLDAFKELLATAHRHISGDRAALDSINSGADFPPQDCFVHTSEQHGEGNSVSPWCSGWMTELLVDPLLRWQEQSGDAQVDDIFIRLARQLRDVGTTWFRGGTLGDDFWQPSVCDDPNDTDDRRMLVPIYGGGIDRDGKRRLFAEYDDYQHCADATALTAAALRSLRRSGQYDKPVTRATGAPGSSGPFKSEGESLLQLHSELSFCAKRAFEMQTREKRDPRHWSAEELNEGVEHPDKFIVDNKIGFPVHSTSPARRLSWWFNTSLEQFSLLTDAGANVPKLANGRIPGPPCKK